MCVFCIPDGGSGPQIRALEPIIEESDDETGCDGEFWSHDDSSSGSGTGSVVQLAEANFLTGVPYSPPEEIDSESERDFLCPPKRRKQELSHHNVFSNSNHNGLLTKSDNSVDLTGGGHQLLGSAALLNSSVKFSPHKIRFDALVDEPDYHKKR